MQLKYNNRFFHRGGSHFGELGLYLPGHFWVYKSAVMEAWNQCEIVLPRLHPQLVFLAKVETGLAELDRSQGIPHDQAKHRFGL